MTTRIKRIAPWLAAAAIGAAMGLAPVASADSGSVPVPQGNLVADPGVSDTAAPTPDGTGTDPLVPYGTNPVSPFRLGYINPNHDEGNTTNGEIDVPF